MSKALLVAGIIAYLFAASFLCAITFQDESMEWDPGFITKPVTHMQNFTEGGNLSDYNIVVTQGTWIFEEPFLVSKNPPAEFFIIGDVMEKPIIEYNISNLNEVDLTALYSFSAKSIAGNTEVKVYWVLNRKDDFITCVWDKKTLWGLFSETKILYSGHYDLNSQHIFKIVNNRTTAYPTAYGVSELYIDEEKIALVEIDEFPHADRIAGINTEQSDLKVSEISETEMQEEESTISILSYLSIIGEILTFKAPKIMPWYITFIVFYIPIIAIIWIGAEMIRGN